MVLDVGRFQWWKEDSSVAHFCIYFVVCIPDYLSWFGMFCSFWIEPARESEFVPYTYFLCILTVLVPTKSTSDITTTCIPVTTTSPSSTSNWVMRYCYWCSSIGVVLRVVTVSRFASISTSLFWVLLFTSLENVIGTPALESSSDSELKFSSFLDVVIRDVDVVTVPVFFSRLP